MPDTGNGNIPVDNNQKSYKRINSLKEYAQQLLRSGTLTVAAVKKTKIAVRPGRPGERVISWSADARGNAVVEKCAVVSEKGDREWIASKADEQGKKIIDRNGHPNEWIIAEEVLRKKYIQDPVHKGLYDPVSSPQIFLQVSEPVHVTQWGEEWFVDAGGFINISSPDDMYIVSARDFKDTYRILERRPEDF